MGRAKEVLWVGPERHDLEEMVVPGSLIPSDHPFAVEQPENVVDAPPRDGTFVVIVGCLHRGEIVRLGQIVTAKQAERLGDLVMPGPVEQDHLRQLSAAATYNRADNREKRRREREEGLAKRRARAEAQARAAQDAASEAQLHADVLRVRADQIAERAAAVA